MNQLTPRYKKTCNIRLTEIRSSLVKRSGQLESCNNAPESYIPGKSHVYITLFQAGLRPIRWGATRNNYQSTINRVINRLSDHKRISDFSIDDPNICRILYEHSLPETEILLSDLHTKSFDFNRFEPGIHGLKYIHNNIVRYFMPTDAFTGSVMTTNQLYNFLTKKIGIAKLTNNVKERISILLSQEIEVYKFKSYAEVSHGNSALPLYRGLPIIHNYQPEYLKKTIITSGNWLLKNQNTNGSHLYFYDLLTDSKVDFQHPKATAPLYNNILRHCGATITLIRIFQITKDRRMLDAAVKSADYFGTTLRSHNVDGSNAFYPYYNKKSKLGGAGIGLVALMMLYRLGLGERYVDKINGLVTHIRSRIESDGEMIGYYRHPSINKGEPIDSPDCIQKKQLFSFYYPGEALLGLALYLLYFDTTDSSTQQKLKHDCQKCLDFLVHVRPIRYADQFTSLPADAWLMQAIEELSKIKGICTQSHFNFVFNDANSMCSNMYNTEDAYPDYTGGFYYNFGDHVYQDGSRCEGLISAYNLAIYLGNTSRADFYLSHIDRAAKGLLNTWNSSESSYCHLYPENSVGTFRFKLTRQWIRVDSIQHTVCFYSRYLQALENKQVPNYI